MFDESIIPVFNVVSSEWEKNEVIRSAYGRARTVIVPQLIDLLENHADTGAWIKETRMFGNKPISELWTKPDYAVIHSANSDTDSKLANLQGTSTQLFVRILNEKVNDIPKKKIPKDFPDKCLLRHRFSGGDHWLTVCRLRRRHQKEIAKLPSLTSKSSGPPSSSAILDQLLKASVLKFYKENSMNPGEISGEPKQNAAKTATESGIDAVEGFADDQSPSLKVLQKETNTIIVDALSIVRAAERLKVGEVPKTSVVRWKSEEEFEIRYFE